MSAENEVRTREANEDSINNAIYKIAIYAYITRATGEYCSKIGGFVALDSIRGFWPMNANFEAMLVCAAAQTVPVDLVNLCQMQRRAIKTFLPKLSI